MQQIVILFWMMVLNVICISGCSYVKTVDQNDPFRRLYSAGEKKLNQVQVLKEKAHFLTLSCYKMPLPLFCRVLSDKFKIGLVFSEKLVTKELTAEFKETDLSSVLNVLSRQFSVDIVRVGNTFYIGDLRPEDRVTLVRRVLSYDRESLERSITSMLSDKGRSAVMADSVVLVTDVEPAVRRIGEMLDYISVADIPTWILQLCFVAIRKDALNEAGFDISTSGTLSYNISENRLDLKDFKIDGLFNMISQSSFMDLYASPMLLLRDGTQGTWKDGERVPIPRKSVSQYGVVTVTGYDYQHTGFNVSAIVRESRTGGRLQLQIDMSEIQSYVSDAPLVNQNVYNIDVDLQPGKPYLIGELNTFKVLNKQNNVLMLSDDRGKTVLQVWAQLYRLGSESTSEVIQKSGYLWKR